MTEHTQHGSHADHEHGPGCGHEAIEHEGHTDYLHDGPSHAQHEGQWDEHEMRMGPVDEGASRSNAAMGEQGRA